MPYNTIPAYRELDVSIDAAGDPDTPVAEWAAAHDRSMSVGPLTDTIGESVLVSGWVTFYDPDRDDWPVVHRAPFRSVEAGPAEASLPWTVGDRRIYPWTNPADGLSAVTLDGPVIAHDGDLYCAIAGGSVQWR